MLETSLASIFLVRLPQPIFDSLCPLICTVSLSLGTAVTVFGFRNATSGNFSVKLDNDTVTRNGASSAEVATTLFYSTGLNNSFHTLTITNEDDSLLAVGSINVTTASSPLYVQNFFLSHPS